MLVVPDSICSKISLMISLLQEAFASDLFLHESSSDLFVVSLLENKRH